MPVHFFKLYFSDNYKRHKVLESTSMHPNPMSLSISLCQTFLKEVLMVR
ncbi:Uncharacterised protein [Staphylococcus aureus]|nr:Uncharacterised protein [Staphylococcus aureus]CAC6806080.1 Uncharacterised protein [Staphylococcus aureus]CAC6925958.1 Uncharacterised protein [Staphylococcus aureus]CAC6939701.1 Uncharacterised protein [Staphylococcus aureus]